MNNFMVLVLGITTSINFLQETIRAKLRLNSVCSRLIVFFCLVTDLIGSFVVLKFAELGAYFGVADTFII